MKNPWRIVFMGTPDFACPSLVSLAKSEDQVVGVFTQPDRPQGRGLTMHESPVKATAQEFGIPVFQPEKLNHDEALSVLQELHPHLIVVVAYGQILSERVLHIPKHQCINVHASLLPKYRGAAPINGAIIRGETETGITTMLMSKGLDAGDILLQRSIPIGSRESAGELHDRLAVLGAETLRATVLQWKEGAVTPRKQNEAEATFAPSLKKEDGRLDWSKSAHDLYNQVRGMDPWPGSITTIEGKMLRALRADCLEEHTADKPGTILRADEKGIIVATGEGALALLEVQLQGKKRLPVADFLRGKKVTPGTKLG